MANLFLNGGWLNVESRGIAIPAIILAVSSVASRLLGVARDWLLSERFGASADLDAYFAAFRIPDLIYNLLVFGGIVVAFLPLFSDYYAKDKAAAWRFANNLLNVFVALLVLVSVVLFVFTPEMVVMVAPGFTAAQLAKTAFLSRIMFLSPIIFGIASIFSGILQYFHRFLAYSLAAALYNIGIIAGILFLGPYLGIYGVAIGVIFGALLYLLVQVLPAINCGYRYRPVFDLKAPSLRQAVYLMLPRTLGIAANQLNLIAPTVIASSLAAGSITIFNLANNVYGIPVGIIGISWATAAFASFSRAYTEGKYEELADKFSASYRQIGYLAVPASFLLFVLRQPIVNFLYYHGQFTREAALLTSASLGLFCLGIYFSSMMPVVFRLFFSTRDTASPTWSTVISVAVNITLNYVFVALLASGPLAGLFSRIFGLEGIADISVLGLALAYSMANMLQLAILVYLVGRKKSIPIRFREIAVSLIKTIIAGVFMAIAVYFVSGALPQNGMVEILVNMALASLAGGIVYIVATILLKSPEVILFKKFLRPKIQR